MAHLVWDPDAYPDMIRSEVPEYARLQEETVAATGAIRAETILELDTGTGETTRRVLDAHPNAHLIGVDASAAMLDTARRRLSPQRASLRLAEFEEPLPAGPFDLVVSVLAVHHLLGPAKADLFTRVHAVLRPKGRFVLADVVVPERPRDAITPLDPEHDHPSRVDEQLRWLTEAGLAATVVWEHADLAVLAADRR